MARINAPSNTNRNLTSIDQGNAPAPRRVDPRTMAPAAPRGIRPANIRGVATRRMPRNTRY